MNVEAYYQSLTIELEALKNRVRNFIEGGHWPTDGEWKESVIRSMLRDRLPDSVKVGRGFIINADTVSTQCDVLLYKANAPVLFREGDLVFITPDAVLAVVEVKSRTTRLILEEVLDKFAGIGQILGPHRVNITFGLFSYENAIGNQDHIIQSIQIKCNDETKIIDIICLGCSKFIKWWKLNPHNNDIYGHWHLYTLENMAAGYFLTNLIFHVCPESIENNNQLWFPEEGKEIHLEADITFVNALNNNLEGV